VDPNYYVTQANLAACLCDLGQYPEAVERFRRTFALAPPPNANIYARFALSLDKIGQSDEAIDAYRQAIAIDPTSVLKTGGPRVEFMREGRAEDIRLAWQRALDASPGEHAAYDVPSRLAASTPPVMVIGPVKLGLLAAMISVPLPLLVRP